MKVEQRHSNAFTNKEKCRFWNGNDLIFDIGYITKIDKNGTFKFYLEKTDKWYQNCEPMRIELYVKEWFEVAKQLHEGNYVPDKDKKSFVCDHKLEQWHNEMWSTCGKKYEDVKHFWTYRAEWLEVREA